jgi:SAM-dependent methyltransferase
MHRMGGSGLAPADPDARIAACGAMFDRFARESESASVAGYCLGSDALLAEATAEVVDVLERWGVLRPDADVLQIGCCIGRFEAALAPRVRRAWGIDVSAEMIARARRRCARFGNVHLAVASGTRLEAFADASVDLVYAVDSLPYIDEAGPDLLDRVFAETRRVLVPGGHAAAFNVRYGVSRAAERADVQALAVRHGFSVLVDGVAPFRCWDGTAFLLGCA